MRTERRARTTIGRVVGVHMVDKEKIYEINNAATIVNIWVADGVLEGLRL